MPPPYFARDAYRAFRDASRHLGPPTQPPVEEISPVQSMREKFLAEVRDTLQKCGIEELDTSRLLAPATITIDEEASRILQGDNQQPPKLPPFLIYCVPGTTLKNPNGAVKVVAVSPSQFEIDIGQIVRAVTVNLTSPVIDDKYVVLLVADNGTLRPTQIIVPSHWKRLFGPDGRFQNEEKPVSEEQKLAKLMIENPVQAWEEMQRKIAAFPEYQGSLILPQGTRNAVVEGTNVRILQKRNFFAQNIRFTLALPPKQIARFLELCGKNQFEDDHFKDIFKSENQTADRLSIDAEIIFDTKLPLGKIFFTARKGRWDGLTHVEESPHPVSPEVFAHFLGLLKPAEQRTPLMEKQGTIFKRQPRPEAPRRNRQAKRSPAEGIRRAFEELEQGGTIFVGSQPNPEPKKTKKPTSSRERKAARRTGLKAERKNKGKKRK